MSGNKVTPKFIRFYLRWDPGWKLIDTTPLKREITKTRRWRVQWNHYIYQKLYRYIKGWRARPPIWKNLIFVKDASHNTPISGYMIYKLTRSELLVPHNLHTSSFPSIFYWIFLQTGGLSLFCHRGAVLKKEIDYFQTTNLLIWLTQNANFKRLGDDDHTGLSWRSDSR